MIKDIEEDAKGRMKKTIIALKNTLGSIRAGRAHPNLLNQIQVEYYGTNTPINQVASISVEDTRTLKVAPFEKTMVEAIEKAIISSNLGLNPNTVGQIIRIPMPALTEQRRNDLIKVVKESGEKSKIAIRNIRRDANQDFKELHKEGDISTDLAKMAENNIQTTTDDYIKEIDAIINEKESQLKEI